MTRAIPALPAGDHEITSRSTRRWRGDLPKTSRVFPLSFSLPFLPCLPALSLVSLWPSLVPCPLSFSLVFPCLAFLVPFLLSLHSFPSFPCVSLCVPLPALSLSLWPSFPCRSTRSLPSCLPSLPCLPAFLPSFLPSFCLSAFLCLSRYLWPSLVPASPLLSLLPSLALPCFLARGPA